ncbi:uncharacterized protein B0I36DRAFT_313828 [Microdochium trichocladiopsis]|uniref:Uncharacterized protein n=1 Tax=Microdochium trichocladiopsis TaxID=1682393 RepID=A0A9P8YG63_9PEZI|nr:uncharacterized protein B0I36DRAFT_313828 [Microdochium trichocladiopsis]KAH7037343.1 hypothetical protein B0I36DRAFT_313828 [Microdochium trichocladiopsis]
MGNPDKEQPAATHRSTDADGPPAYTSTASSLPDAPPYEGPATGQRRMSTSSSVEEEGPRKPGKIPGAINSYWQTSMSRTFHLGEHRDAPLFAVKSGSGWTTKKPGLTIFDGPNSSDYPMLTGATRASMFGRKYDISLPPLANSGSSEYTKETISIGTSWSRQVHKFTIEVESGPKGETRREDFEWRSTRGDEVRELGSKWLRGWKLVRLSSEAFRGPGGERHARDEGTTSDGKEIVAVWAHNSSWSMTKAFKFRFRGSALAGELGERFDLMALMTGLNMWHQEVAASAATSGAAA